jgi:hypothetical protein
MSALFKVAGIPILIRGEGFLDSLSDLEAALIKPFIKGTKATAALKERAFSVDIKVIDRIGLRRNAKLDYKLIEKMKSVFSGNGSRFQAVFNIFATKNLPCYLTDSSVKQRLLAGLFNADTDCNKLMISQDSFLLFNRSQRHCDIYYTPPKLPKELQRLSDVRPYKLNVLRLFLRMVMNLKNDGISLHASSLEDRGFGYVFIGPSGAGKTTVAELLHPARILSDDTAIIRKINNVYKIFPNPWCNDGIKIKYPMKGATLRGIFFIQQAGNTNIKRLNYKEALSKLIYDDHPFQQYGFFDNRTGIRNFYLFSQELIQRIPVFELKVKRSGRFKQEFQRLLSKNLK